MPGSRPPLTRYRCRADPVTKGHGQPTGVAYRQRQGIPAGQSTEFDHRWGDLGGTEHGRRSSGRDGTVGFDLDDPICVLHDPLESVLGQDHRHTQVVHEASDGGKHLFGSGRIQRRGRLVENQDTGVSGQHRSDGHPLLLAARQLMKGPVPQVGDAQEIEGLLDTLAHDIRRNCQLLHAVGKLLLDGVGGEAGEWILSDHPDHVGQLPWRTQTGLAPVDQHPPGHGAAGEVGDQTVDRTEQRGFAHPGAPDHQSQLTFVDARGTRLGGPLTSPPSR